MAYSITPNQTPASFGGILLAVKTALVAKGWTVVGSGDGLAAYSASGDVITNASFNPSPPLTVAGSMCNPNAWFRIRCPAFGGKTRELLFQTRASRYLCDWKYSANAGFSGGTPSATVAPTATDSATIVNNTFFVGSSNEGAKRVQCVVGGASEAWGFAVAIYPTGGGNPEGAFVMDPIATGGGPTEDPDPYVFMGGQSNNVLRKSAMTIVGAETSQPQTWFKYGLAGAGFMPCAATNLSADGYDWIGNLGSDPHNGKEVELPVIYGRNATRASPNGFKGWSSLFRFKASNLTTGNTLGGLTRIVIGDVTLPWDGATVPSL